MNIIRKYVVIFGNMNQKWCNMRKYELYLAIFVNHDHWTIWKLQNILIIGLAIWLNWGFIIIELIWNHHNPDMVGRFTTRMLSRLLAARPVTELWCQARSVVSLDTFKSSVLLSNHHTFQGELQKKCLCVWLENPTRFAKVFLSAGFTGFKQAWCRSAWSSHLQKDETFDICLV